METLEASFSDKGLPRALAGVVFTSLKPHNLTSGLPLSHYTHSLDFIVDFYLISEPLRGQRS